MTSRPDKTRELTALGAQILSALDGVEKAARSALASDSPALSMPTLTYPSNRMVGDDKPERFVAGLNADAKRMLRLLLTEPFIARVKVDWGRSDGGVQTLYFASRSAAGLSKAIDGAFLVSYLDDLGRLAEHSAGDLAEIEVRGRERKGRILECAVIEPTRAKLWDALIEAFSTMPWGDVVSFLGDVRLRSALDLMKGYGAAADGAEDIVGELQRVAAEAEMERQRSRRKVIDRITLRNRAVLNRFQGEIFRLPLDRQVILLGPPGSGKTTTLIKRLAQKRTVEALTERDRSLASGYVLESLARPDSWAMFSPAELLKQYLGDAFAKIGVPDAGNVRTWDQERHDLARHVLFILRSAAGGAFQSEPNPALLLDPSSPGVVALYDDFAEWFEIRFLGRCNAALDALLAADDEELKRSAQALRRRLGRTGKLDISDIPRLLDTPEELQVQQRRLEDRIATEIKAIANSLLHRYRTLPNEIAAELRASANNSAETTEEREDDEDGQTAAPAQPINVLLAALRNWARALAEKRTKLGGRSGQIITLLGSRLPPENRFADLGASLNLLAQIRELLQAPRGLVLGAPRVYAEFRRERAARGRHFAGSDTHREYFNRNKISPDELDVVILVMLRHARRLLLAPGPDRLELATPHEWLEKIKARYLMQVFVDEATDLSAVQLACTVELAYPRLRSWFACGDFRQRLTVNGIAARSELAWLGRTTGIRLDAQDINIGYRQSRRLREFSDALGRLLDAEAATTMPPQEDEELGAPPLLIENVSSDGVAAWLARRIREVELAIGRLPAIAIFVDGDDRVEELSETMASALAPWNIVVKARAADSSVGDPREVRVFDVNSVKGMEFEAVFFVSIDDLAERSADLFNRYLYVGVTRAATYLGVTCEGNLPANLASLRPLFSNGTWSDDV